MEQKRQASVRIADREPRALTAGLARRRLVRLHEHAERAADAAGRPGGVDAPGGRRGGEPWRGGQRADPVRDSGPAARQRQAAPHARRPRRPDRRRSSTKWRARTGCSASRCSRATGERELSSGTGGPPPGAGRGFGPGAAAGGGASGREPAGAAWPRAWRRTGAAAGPPAESGGIGPGGPGSMGALAERLLSGAETEAVSDVHGSRWDRGWRLSAGVRRANGGAIVLNVDASEIAELSRRASLDHLLEDIAARAPEIAYVVLEDGTNRIAYGPLADAATRAPDAVRRGVPVGADPAGARGARRRRARRWDRRPSWSSPGRWTPRGPTVPTLRLGLKLDGLRRAERRTLTRLTLSLAAALALGIVMIAFVVLRQQFGVLSEKHARAEEALRRRDRLAAMGELASTVAHEVRNPLNAIGMTAQRLRREFLDGDRRAAAPDDVGAEGTARRARRRDPAHQPHRAAVPRLREAAAPLAAAGQPARHARSRRRGAAREGGHAPHHHRQRSRRRRRRRVRSGSAEAGRRQPAPQRHRRVARRRPRPPRGAPRRVGPRHRGHRRGARHSGRHRAEDLRPVLHDEGRRHRRRPRRHAPDRRGAPGPHRRGIVAGQRARA